MFDVEQFASRLHALGVRTTVTPPPASKTAAGRLGDFDSVQALASFYAAKPHLRCAVEAQQAVLAAAPPCCPRATLPAMSPPPPHTHTRLYCGRLDCPAFRVPADLIVKHERLVFAAMDAMSPSPPLQEVISRQVQVLCGHAACSLQLATTQPLQPHKPPVLQGRGAAA